MMTNLKNGQIVSLLRIEPVNTDEYNRNLVKQLACHHKQKILACIRKEHNFLNAPESYSNLCENLTNDFNRYQPACGQMNWLRIFRAWVNIVSASTTSNIRSKEDKELFELISMQQSKSSDRETMTSEGKSIKSMLTHCRICLASSSTKMIFLYNERPAHHQNAEELTLLEKLNYCSCFTTEANIDDGLPHYICMSCSILIENAYQLKKLCAKTEAKLHEIQQLSIQSEFKMLQQPENSNVQIIPDGELNESECSLRSKENEQKSSNVENPRINSLTNKTKLRENLEHIEIDDAISLELPVPAKIKPKTDKSQAKNDESKKTSYQCEMCCKWFRVKTSLAIHMRSHTNERPYSCEVCGKAFKTSGAANSHRVVHADTKDFKCSDCPFSTNTKSNLKIHERTHSRIQPYQCRFCEMKFRTASNVAKHMRNIHEKQKTNKCDKCSRSFFTRESLRKHSIKHTGLKPFNCPGCSLSYTWYNGLKKHIRAQHSNENIRIPTEKMFFEKLKNLLPQ